MINEELQNLIDIYGIDKVKNSLNEFLFNKRENEFQNNWNLYYRIYGFQKEDFGRSFVINKNVYTILGINPRNRKYPIIASNNNGVNYKFAPITVTKSLLPK